MLTQAYADSRSGLYPWDALWLALLASPLAAVFLLMWNPAIDPPIEVPGFHFSIVTLAAAMAAMVALVVLAVAEQLHDARAFFLGLGFCAIGGFFFIHGLLTPGVVLRKFSTGIGWAPLLSLFLGSACLALSTARQRPTGEPWVFRHRKAMAAALLLVWAGFLTVSITFPQFLSGHPTSLVPPPQASRSIPAPASDRGGRLDDHAASAPAAAATVPARKDPWIAGALITSTAALLLFSALRYIRLYRLSRLPLHATVVAGIVLLLEGLVPLSFGTVWRLSWWGYHVLILFAVVTILSGMILDVRRGASMTQTISALLLKGSVEALEQSYSEVLTGLVAAVEARDPYTKGHSEKVARLAVHIGEQLGLPPERLRVLHQAGLVHDIGKIGIPDGILNKPGRLTPAEVDVVREHPVRSEEMIGRIPSLRPSVRAIRWHHERLDGSGYPDGLAGEVIPLDARILAVADVFDAMTSGRSYRAAWPVPAVLAHLEREAGRLYDTRCVEAVKHVLWSQPEAVPTGTPYLLPSN